MEVLTKFLCILVAILLNITGTLGGEFCSYYDSYGDYNLGSYCSSSCCGTGSSQYCCSESYYYYNSYYIIYIIVGCVIGVITLTIIGAVLCCLFCACCPGYQRRMANRGRVLRTTTNATQVQYSVAPGQPYGGAVMQGPAVTQPYPAQPTGYATQPMQAPPYSGYPQGAPPQPGTDTMEKQAAEASAPPPSYHATVPPPAGYNPPPPGQY